MDLDPSKGVAVFTDGSSNWKDRSGGWAWIALDAFDGLESDSGARSNTTNNQMELAAPAEALEALHEAYGPIEVLVHSDSEYVVLGITHRARKRNVNKTEWKRLDEAVDTHSFVRFEHVKGHAENEYNNLVDRMAVTARKSAHV
jgi:ribonuclease HI